MKKALLSLLIGAAGISAANAYVTKTVQDSISTNTRWTANQQYLLKGYVYVTSGATLTIDSGTIIRGDKNTKGALIIERGAKIDARGTKTSPIIFTSNQPASQRYYGDWGGVVICGSSPTNWNSQDQLVEGGPRSRYGGTNPADNSGVMSYVRIEFGGIAFSPNNEVNGLTLYGVGNATQLDHIQVSYSGDDAFEWFGGNVNSKYMIAYRTWDDDFDNDAGYSGKNQFLTVMRDPQIADQSGSKAFESDSYLSGSYSGNPFDATKVNSSVWSNVTAVGPMLTPTTIPNSNYVAGVHMRRGSGMSLLNSIVVGFPAGLLLDEPSATYGSTVANINNGTLQFRNNIIAGIATTSTNAPGGNKDVVFFRGDANRDRTPTNTNATDTAVFGAAVGPFTWIRNSSNGNAFYTTESQGVRLFAPFNLSNPNMIPTTTSPVIYNTRGNGSATAGFFNPSNPINYDTTNNYANYNVPQVAPDFTNSKASDAFFTKVNYVGAFTNTNNTSDNWMAGWANFDPVNANYEYVVVPPVDTPTSITLISSFSGARVFPNPANNSATVVVNMTKTGDIAINMVDISGKLVKQIFNGSKTAGSQSFSIDLSSVNTGLYFIAVSSGDNQKTIKLNVIK